MMKKKILIIEDDKDTLEILGYLAEELNIDFDLRSGVISLSEIKEIDPKLIMLDHWVKNGNGGELCSRIKQDAELAGVPVVIVSAHNRLPDIAKDNGADGYLAKPFEIDAIQGLIRRYTG